MGWDNDKTITSGGQKRRRGDERYNRLELQGRGMERSPDEPSPYITENLFARYLQERIQNGEHPHVLDIGCGRGRHTLFLAQHGCEVVGIEPSAEFRATTLHRLKEAGVVADIKEGYADALPLEDESCDAVVAVGVLHHGTWDSVQKYMAEEARVLKPNGLLAMVVRSINDNERPRTIIQDHGLTAADLIDDDDQPLDAEHQMNRHYFTVEELHQIARAYGFEIIDEPSEINIDARVKPGSGKQFDPSGRERRIWVLRTIMRKKADAAQP